MIILTQIVSVECKLHFKMKAETNRFIKTDRGFNTISKNVIDILKAISVRIHFNIVPVFVARPLFIKFRTGDGSVEYCTETKKWRGFLNNSAGISVTARWIIYLVKFNPRVAFDNF